MDAFLKRFAKKYFFSGKIQRHIKINIIGTWNDSILILNGGEILIKLKKKMTKMLNT